MFQHGVEGLLTAFDEHARNVLNPMSIVTRPSRA
jgi:hypothetical protein